VNTDRARARVSCLLRASRRIQDPADSLGREARDRLPEVTGLTGQSIELALQEHFETNPTDADINALLASTSTAPVCHVSLSANVFLAPLRALALALATSEVVYVRPSRRDPVVTELLFRALSEDREFAANSKSLELVEMVCPEPGHELHLYGSDENLAAIMSTLPEGVIVRAHGSGLGLAVVSPDDDLSEAADALALDIGAFDQRGCLSPRFILVEGGAIRGESFGAVQHRALLRYSEKYPRGAMDPGLEAEIAQYRATIESIGTYWEGPSHGVGFDPHPRSLVLPPPARIIHIVTPNEFELETLLAPWIRYVTTVGTNAEIGLSRKLKEWLPHARWTRLGDMQRPRLDGPVDQRTQATKTACWR
jgi:Acyl-CoA reductase (LuxC)